MSLFGSQMEESLINANQLQANGLIVDTCPKQYSGGKSFHGIYHEEEDMLIPFCMHGCISYFALNLPTQTEINYCQQIIFTPEQEWDPYYSQTFETIDKAYEKKECGPTEGECFTQTGSESYINIDTTSSHNWHSTVHAISLAHRWGTSIKQLEHPHIDRYPSVRFYPAEEFSQHCCTRQGQLHFSHLQTKW